MKHSYTVDCDCKRCVRELARRTAQSVSAPRFERPKRLRRDRHYYDRESYPHGSQQWAEARGGLIGGYEEN